MSAHRGGRHSFQVPVKWPDFVVGEIVPIKGYPFKVVCKTKRGLSLRRLNTAAPATEEVPT